MCLYRILYVVFPWLFSGSIAAGFVRFHCCYMSVAGGGLLLGRGVAGWLGCRVLREGSANKCHGWRSHGRFRVVTVQLIKICVVIFAVAFVSVVMPLLPSVALLWLSLPPC